MQTALSIRALGRHWSYDELCQEMEETNQPVELWEGKLVMSPSPTPNHQLIVGRLYRLLHEHVCAADLGQVFFAPLDVVLSPHRVVQPDIIFLSNKNAAKVQSAIHGVPDLVIEVVSQGTWRRDRIEKKNLYEQIGVTEYWIVDPEAGMVEIFGAVNGAYELLDKVERGATAKSRLLAGFEPAVDAFLESREI